MNYLVDTKIEYTTQIVNILSPFVYEGLASIYDDTKKIAKSGEELKIFQGLLRKIPIWNKNVIDKETQRILKQSNCDWLEDLVKATIKANIILLTNTSPTYSFKFLDEKTYQNIDLNDFIHKCYIESARELYNNPYLFYHKYPHVDLKRNQRDTIYLIKNSIKEAVRKMLPVQHILKEYLGGKYQEHSNENFENTISEAESANLKNLIKSDYKNSIISNTQNLTSLNNIIQKSVTDPSIINKLIEKPQNIKNNLNSLVDCEPLENTNLNTLVNCERLANTNLNSAVGGKPIENNKLESEKKSTNPKNKSDSSSSSLHQLEIEQDTDSDNTMAILDNIREKIKIQTDYKSELSNKDSKNILLNLDNHDMKAHLLGKSIEKKNENKILKNSVYDNVSSESESSLSYNKNNNEEFEDIFSNFGGTDNISLSNKVSTSKSNLFIKEEPNNKSSKNEENKIKYFAKYTKV